MAPADDLLKKLRRLPANMVCANCGSDAQKGIGFGNICVAFKTFVCDYCKTSHQAISHRVKSVSMSEWTMDEVRELTAERGGGNDAARNIWLANAPAIGKKYNGGTRPKKGDRIEFFKQFILDCYELGKFKGDAAGTNCLVSGGSGNISNEMAERNGNRTVKHQDAFAATGNNIANSSENSSKGGPWGPSIVAAVSQPEVKAAVAAVAAPFVDLLGFDDAAPVGGSGDSFDFIDSTFSSTSNATSTSFGDFSETTTTSTTLSSGDPFGNSDAFTSSGYDAFGTNNTANNYNTPNSVSNVISKPVTGLNNPGINTNTSVMFGQGGTPGGVSGLASPRSMAMKADAPSSMSFSNADPFSSLAGGSRSHPSNGNVSVHSMAPQYGGNSGVAQHQMGMSGQMGQRQMGQQQMGQQQMGMGGQLQSQPQLGIAMSGGGRGSAQSVGVGMNGGMTAPQGSMSLNGPNARIGTIFDGVHQSSMTSNSRSNVSTAFAFDPMQLSSLGGSNYSSSSSGALMSSVPGQSDKKAVQQDAFASLFQ